MVSLFPKTETEIPFTNTRKSHFLFNPENGKDIRYSPYLLYLSLHHK